MNIAKAKNTMSDAFRVIDSLGDGDESSVKHIEHALIALVEGTGILNAIDYRKPKHDISNKDWLKCLDAWSDIATVFAIHGKELTLECHKIYSDGYDIKTGYAYALFSASNKQSASKE